MAESDALKSDNWLDECERELARLRAELATVSSPSKVYGDADGRLTAHLAETSAKERALLRRRIATLEALIADHKGTERA